ncbi:MAG: nitroreductase family protein [Anaerolineae bacterium]
MDLFDAIARRHSYRGPMLDEPVSRDDLRRIVQAGIQAPSGYNGQTTRFVVVDDTEQLAQMAAIDPECGVLRRARAVIACVAPRGPAEGDQRLFFGVEDCSAAAENMLLAITALGYASVWLDGWLRYEGHDDAVAALLGVPEDRIVRVLLPLGRPAREEQQHAKLPWDERAWFGRYGG